MRTLTVVVVVAVLGAACSPGSGADGGSGGGGTGGAGGGSGGSGGGDAGTDAGTPMTPIMVTGGLTATINTSGPTAAWQQATNRSGVQFATLPASANPGVTLAISTVGQLSTGTFDATTPGFTCAISVTDGSRNWLAAVVGPDGGTSTGQCSITLSSVSVRFMASDGISYAVRGSVSATVPFTGAGTPAATVNATF